MTKRQTDRNSRIHSLRIEGVALPGEEKVGHRGQHGCDPADGGHQGSSLQVREGEHVEGPADGQVPLQGEGQDSQHVGVGGAEI